MRGRPGVALLLALVVGLCGPTVTSASTGRHTPGFPNFLLEDLLGSLKLDPRLLEIMRSVAGSASSGTLTGEALARAASSALTSGAPLDDVAGALRLLSTLSDSYAYSGPVDQGSLMELLNLIENEELLGDLAALVEGYRGGTLTASDIEGVLGNFGAYLMAGAKPGEILAAAEVLELLGRSIGSDVPAVDRAIELLADSGVLKHGVGAVEGVDSLLSLLLRSSKGQPYSPEPIVPSLVDLGGASLPRASAPLGASLPSLGLPSIRVDPDVVLPLAALPVLTLVALAVARLAPKRPLARLLPRGRAAPPALELSGVRPAVRNYWVAVSLLERRGLTRGPHETHREYLSRVAGAGGRAFEGLTEAYELAKYAQVESEDVDRASDGYLRELVGGGGG